MNCPHCHERLGLLSLRGTDLSKLACPHCSATLAVKTRVGLLPAVLLILLGAPVARAVQVGWISIAWAIAGGVALLLAAGWVGYRWTSVSLIRVPPEAGESSQQPTRDDRPRR